jgi:hypothetical protein
LSLFANRLITPLTEIYHPPVRFDLTEINRPLTEIDRPPPVLASLCSHKSNPPPRCLSMLTESPPILPHCSQKSPPHRFASLCSQLSPPPVLSLYLVTELPIVIHEEENSSRKNMFFF